MKRKIKNWSLGVLWVLGLILAGSESHFLPATNFLGVLVIGVSSYFIVDKKAGFMEATEKPVRSFGKIKPHINRDGMCLHKGC